MFEWITWRHRITERLERLERILSNEVTDLVQLKADVDAHNAALTVFQTDVTKKVTDIEAAVAAGNSVAVDAAISDLKTAVAATPTLVLPA